VIAFWVDLSVYPEPFTHIATIAECLECSPLE
jgi:hypothetical protein